MGFSVHDFHDGHSLKNIIENRFKIFYRFEIAVIEKIRFETNFVYNNYCAFKSADYFHITFKMIFEVITLLSHTWIIFCQATTEYCKILSKEHLNTKSISMTHIQIKLRKIADLQQAYGECR